MTMIWSPLMDMALSWLAMVTRAVSMVPARSLLADRLEIWASPMAPSAMIPDPAVIAPA